MPSSCSSSLYPSKAANVVECLCHVLLEATCSQNTANYIISFTLETKCVLIGARSQRVSEEIIHPFLLLFLSGLRQTPK